MPVFSNHSDELQQMMGRIPGWMLRWGLWLLAIIFIGVAVGCYFIKYPQKVTGMIQLTAYNPPVELISMRSGRIARLFVSEGDSVSAGDNILVLESTADYNDVFYIDSLLRVDLKWNEWVFDETIYRHYSLGDLQSLFLQFQKECAAVREYISSELNVNRDRLLGEQITKQEKLLKYQRDQLSIIMSDYELAKKNFSRDSIMFSVEGLSQADYERAQQSLLQKELAVINHNSSIGSTEATLLSMRSSMVDNAIQDESQLKSYYIEMDRLHRQLTSQIETWRRENILTSPIEGRVFLSNVWSVNQNVMMSQRVATVMPHEEADVKGRMAVPFAGYSKIEVGQSVNVRLDNYPHMEFGTIKGRVYSISPIPEQEGYVVDIDFPEGLTSSYGIPVNYVYNMTGTADIITKDMRLIEQFIQPLRAVLDRI